VRRLLIVLPLGLLLLAALVVAACGGGEAKPPAAAPATAPAAPAAPAPGAIVIEVKTTSNPYRFTPDKLELQAGKDYAIRIAVDKEFHTFTVKDLKIEANLDPEKTVTVALKVDKPGKYNLICVPHESLGMVGTITVK
jgi:plastocyanin